MFSNTIREVDSFIQIEDRRSLCGSIQEAQMLQGYSVGEKSK